MQYLIIGNLIPGLPKEPYRNGVGAYEGVVAHATASYAPDENQVSYFINNWQKRQAFVQYFVDWDSIRQTSDINFKAWGAGPTANKRYVHVELCQTKDPKLFVESYKRYVWLLAWILRRRNLGVIDGKTLVSHDFCSKTFKDTNHTDPIGYLAEHGITWAKLVADVKAEYDKIDVNGDYIKTSTGNPQENEKAVDKVFVEINGKRLSVQGYLQDGHSSLPVRAVAEAVGARVEWFPTNKQIKVNGKDITEEIIGGTGYSPARELAAALGLQVDWDGTNKTVKLSKGCVCDA
ncbi:stalk domain-containing protein [Brevibacillus sp. HD1.4A]|uniref:stalk domain-containing protein n=1 Tax=Brevibacillus sp. HD1.4A TaxID=2738978 RepID=UPI001C2C51EA|nr:stalk domain-containing protein [Brevibacillus sp. HD1.4A]